MTEGRDIDGRFDVVFERIANGESVRKILAEEGMPPSSSFYKALKEDPEIVERYMRAREIQADKLFDECLEIADQYEADTEKGEGGTDHIQRARLRIDTRKWMAGKMRPKVYGDKLAVGGADDLPPIQAQDNMINDVELARRVAFLLQRGIQGGKDGQSGSEQE